MPHAWTTWRQSDLPCQYNDDQTDQNAQFLESVLGAQWLAKGLRSPGWQHHRLLEFWGTSGACAYLELNALADDLRQIKSVRGVDGVIRDLKRADSCKSAWHTIHAAAMFARSQSSLITQFFAQDDQKSPDFELESNGVTAVVEAKTVRRSDDHRLHSAFSKRVLSSFDRMAGIDPGFWPPTVLAIIRPWRNSVPADQLMGIAEEVAQVMAEGLRIYDGKDIVVRRNAFNVILGDPFVMPSNAAKSRCLMVVAPCASTETSRIVRLAGKASKQLGSYAARGVECLFFLGIGQIHDPHHIRSRLDSEFSRHLSAISAIYLNTTGTWCQAPKRSKIDFLGCIPNAHASVPADLRKRLATVGIGHSMFSIESPASIVPVYRFASCRGVHGATEVISPDIREIPREWLDGLEC